MFDIPRAHSIDKDGTPSEPLMVWLDGVQQRNVRAYDMDGGWIDRFVSDGHGNVVLSGDEFKCERVFGKVVVTGCDTR